MAVNVPEDQEDLEVANRLGALLSGRYEIEELIGRGGMALVFRATDLRHNRRVAIKLLKPELAPAIGGERFLREIQTTAGLQHPHILTLIDSGASDDLLYYVMPFIDGKSLREKLNAEKQISIDETIRIATDVAAALSYAHENGVIHRDIKPENILLQDGEALVSDFGIAYAASNAGGQRLTETGFSIGTPSYMSPEQATGDRILDQRTDQYSLGCVVYEMLTGEPPYRGATAGATVSKMMTERPTPISVVRDNVPSHVERAVMRALAKVPGDRYPTLDRFVQSLANPDEVTTPLSVRSLHAVSTRFSKRTFGAVLMVFVALSAGVVWFSRSSGASEDPISRQLTFTGDAQSVSLSPDGSFVVFLTNGRKRLVVRDVDGESELVLHESSSALGPPQWSRDGLRILFSAVEGNARRLYAIPRLGGIPTEVSSTIREAGFSANYAFGNNNGEYLISCCRGKLYIGRDPSVVVGRLTIPDTESVSGNLIDVTHVADFVSEVAMSPNGRFVAFIGGFPNERLVVGLVPTSGGQPVILDTRERSWFEGGRPAFTSLRWPEGDRIYFAEHAGSGSRVVSITVDRRGNPTGVKRSVFVNLPSGADFDVIPSKGRLVYAGGVSRSELELVERGIVGSRRLSSGTYTYQRPSLSPSGSRLVYTRAADSRLELLLQDIDSPNRPPSILLPGYRPAGMATWSPDGQRIAAVMDDGNGPAIHVINVESGASNVVATQADLPDAPQWSEDGRSLVFWRGGPELRVVGIDSAQRAPRPLGEIVDLGPPVQERGFPSDSDDTGSEILRPDPGGGPVRGRRFVLAPSGEAFAAYTRASAVGQGALAIFSSAGMRRTLVQDLAIPLGWGRDDTVFFVDDGLDGAGASHVDAIASQGGTPKTWMEFPFRCGVANLTISADGGRAVCAVRETITDVWVVDGLEGLIR